MELRKGEYWLLDSCITGKTPIGWLAAPNVGEVFNVEPHGLDESELVHAILHLIEWGCLAVRWARDLTDSTFTPTREQLVANFAGKLTKPGQTILLSDTEALYYFLTAEGGAAW